MGGRKNREPAATPPNTSGVVPRMWEDEPEPSRTDQTGAIGLKALRSLKRPALMVMAGSATGRVFPIQGSKVTVGRSKQANFTLNDLGISRMHCGISRTGGAYFLSDLGSTHGTLVNGGRADRVELRPGDRIQLGPETVLHFDFYDEADDGLLGKIYEAATRDLLTGALNRRALVERLKGEVAYAIRHRAKLVAVALEIDDFKAIHDSYGHAAGDSALGEIAGLIASTLRSEDAFARVGGEKFVVLGRGLSLRKGAKLAERIGTLVGSRVFESRANRFGVTLHAGVAGLSEVGQPGSGDALLKLADERLEVATAACLNRVTAKT